MAKKKSSPLPKEALQFFVAQGKRGGKKSVEVRKKKYTTEERRQLARKAANARWSREQNDSKK